MEPFGTVLGYAPGGVALYSNSYNIKLDRFSPEYHKSYIGDLCLGEKWDCVEFVRRFLYTNYKMVLPEVEFAKDIFTLSNLYHELEAKTLPLQSFPNGSKQMPVSNSILVWGATGDFKKTGHAAIISEVFHDKIRIIEQGITNELIPKNIKWSRELQLLNKDGEYYIHDNFKNTNILGWVTQTKENENNFTKPITPSSRLKIRHKTIENNGQFSKWLVPANHLQKAYFQVHHEQISNRDILEYFSISQYAEQLLIKATNELHLMFMQATDKVIKDDKLLHLFNVPQSLWGCIRKSWEKRHHQMITGRLDFCLDERGLKMYEYNADSSSCHMESAIVIEKWIRQSGVQNGYNPSKKLLESLTEAWKNSDANHFVHILRDNICEEGYHALFMQEALKRAGYDSEIVHSLDEFNWNIQGLLEDATGRQVNYVWKVWAWETVLEQLRTETEQDTSNAKSSNKVRLLDVLTDPNIIVFEPLWTFIPSNKAILPILWELFPNHPYLLHTDFDLTERLKENGYVAKPFGGRCGSNISMINPEEKLMFESTGNFSKQNYVYQELWCLPKIAGRHLQMCAFTAAGKYAGACLRSDTSLVINYDSLIQPLVVAAED